MSTIQNLFEQAQLAEAAYADFAKFAKPTDALIDEGFSDAQATDFITHWRVVDQMPNTASGFSATVFESVDHPGQYVFAVRGSENLFSIDGSGAIDWFSADIHDIGFQGIALHQALDLYNYLQSLRTPAGQSYQAAYLKSAPAETALLAPLYLASLTGADIYVRQYNAYKAQLESAGYWVNFGTVSSIALGDSQTVLAGTSLEFGRRTPSLQLGSGYDVVGHSLGGHLAMILGRLDNLNVASVETFNPPFFNRPESDQLTEQFFSDLQRAENAANVIRTVSTSFDPSLNHSYDVPGDVVHNIGTVQPGSQTTIFSEKENTNPIGAHLINDITDSLAVYNLFATIDADLNTDPNGVAKITGILNASSNVGANSLEAAVSDLGQLFSVSGTAFKSNEFDTNRDLLYKSLDNIKKKTLSEAGNLQVVSLVNQTSEDLNTLAYQDVAYRYALVNLNPFAVIDVGNTLYGPHNQNEALNLYDPNATTNPGTLTPQYLTDRAAMLAAVMEANTADVNQLVHAGGDSVVYQDMGRSITLDVLSTSNTSVPPLTIFGTVNSDAITGSSGDDHIYAGGGNDTLDGGAGSDYLEGGRGDDTYQNLNEGDTVLDLKGEDTYRITSAASTQVSITDVDGQGRVFLESGNTETLLTGGLHLATDAAGVYTSLDGQLSYTLSGTTLSVSLTGAAGSAPFLTLSDYHDGNLGINLNQAAATTTDIIGSGGDETLYLNNTDSGTTLTVNSGAIQDHSGETTITYPAAASRVILNGGNDYLSVENDLPGLLIYADDTTESGTDGNDTIQLDYQGLNGPPLADTGNGAIVFGGGGVDSFIYREAA